MEEFKALWAENIDAKVETTVRTFNKEDLPDGEVLVEVHYRASTTRTGWPEPIEKRGHPQLSDDFGDRSERRGCGIARSNFQTGIR